MTSASKAACISSCAPSRATSSKISGSGIAGRWEPGRLSLCLKAVGLLPAGPSALPSPVRSGAGSWQRQRALLGVLTAAVRSEPDSQVKQAVTMTKRAIIRWWVWVLWR